MLQRLRTTSVDRIDPHHDIPNAAVAVGFGRKVESPNGEREGRPASGPAKDGADGSGKEGKPSSGNFKRKKDEQPEIDPWAVGIAAAVLAWTLYSLLGSSRPEGSEISWQVWMGSSASGRC